MIAGKNLAINVAGALVAIGVVSILGFVTWALVFKAIPPQNKDALALLIGVLSSNVAMVVGFFYGSSASNRSQQETIDTLAKTASAASAALAPVVPGEVTLNPGDEVTVAAKVLGEVPVAPDDPRA